MKNSQIPRILRQRLNFPHQNQHSLNQHNLNQRNRNRPSHNQHQQSQVYAKGTQKLQSLIKNDLRFWTMSFNKQGEEQNPHLVVFTLQTVI